MGPSTNTLKNLTESFGKPPCLRHLDDSRGAYADGPVWRWPELRLSYDAPLVDLVAMGAVSDVVQLLDKFDIGLLQAAHDGLRYVIHDNFVRGVDRQTIRVINDFWPDNARARASRMARNSQDSRLTRRCLMIERNCGECYRCCVAFGIRELKKHQDQACRHLDGRNPTARCSIYADRPAACRQYICLWRDGLFDDEDRPDKSGVIAHCDYLNDGNAAQLVLTLDKDASQETLLRIHEWVADLNIAQILYRTAGTHHMMIQGRDGTGISGTYVPVDYEGMRFLQTRPIDFKEHADPAQIIVR